MTHSARLGYACINTSLSEDEIQVNRGMMKRTFQARGTTYASELALHNANGLSRIVDWNIDHNIPLYRMSSDMFPWMSEYEFEDLADYASIRKILMEVGKKASENGHRLTFHPGPFNVLASANEQVIDRTIKELRQHGEIMDMLDLPRSPFSKINIHIGGAYGDKATALRRFIKNVERLPSTVRDRLTIENDDKANMFSINDLLKVHDAKGIPIVFDYLHHQFCMGDLTEEEAFHLALDTWPRDITPVVHYSSSKKKYEDPTSTAPSHADFIYERVETYGRTVDIMLEAKAKEKAVFRYHSEFKT
jgi:UV DNA damage endonuclease